MNHALEMMSGPVIGITVLDKTGSSTPAGSLARRTLRLTASGHRRHAGGTRLASRSTMESRRRSRRRRAAEPDDRAETRQPVSITVVNQLPEATAIRWHGISSKATTMVSQVSRAVRPGWPPRSNRARRSKRDSRLRAPARSSTTRTSTKCGSSRPG
jgi:hypothetical protein